MLANANKSMNLAFTESSMSLCHGPASVFDYPAPSVLRVSSPVAAEPSRVFNLPPFYLSRYQTPMPVSSPDQLTPFPFSLLLANKLLQAPKHLSSSPSPLAQNL